MNSQTIIVDTDVASLIIKRALPPKLLGQLLGARIGITFVTLGELHRWTHLRALGARRRTALDAWLTNRPTLPYTNEVARTWGAITAAAVQRGRPRPANDSWIAACCLTYGLPLATLNTKDFADYAEHEGLRLVGG